MYLETATILTWCLIQNMVEKLIIICNTCLPHLLHKKCVTNMEIWNDSDACGVPKTSLFKYIRNINLWSHIAPKLENCFDINYEAFGAVRQVLPGYQWKGDSLVLLAFSGTYRICILNWANAFTQTNTLYFSSLPSASMKKLVEARSFIFLLLNF